MPGTAQTYDQPQCPQLSLIFMVQIQKMWLQGLVKFAHVVQALYCPIKYLRLNLCAGGILQCVDQHLLVSLWCKWAATRASYLSLLLLVHTLCAFLWISALEARKSARGLELYMSFSHYTEKTSKDQVPQALKKASWRLQLSYFFSPRKEQPETEPFLGFPS